MSFGIRSRCSAHLLDPRASCSNAALGATSAGWWNVGAPLRRWFGFPCGLLGDGRLNRGLPNKHAKTWLALEVLLSLDRAIVLSGGFVQFDSDPVAGGEMRRPNEANGGLPTVRQCDRIADRLLHNPAIQESHPWYH